MSAPYWQDDMVTLHHGDCLEVLAEMEAGSVDAIVTDPPYGLEFMGREWDAPWQGDDINADATFSPVEMADGGRRLPRPTFTGSTNPKCRNCKGTRRGRRDGTAIRKVCTCASPSFPNVRATEMLAFQEWCETWAAECLRVLKPGGHLLAFGGTRTYHRLTSGIEDAGFEIRDSMHWIYGSGFPKSLDVSKAIDRQRNDRPAILRVTSWVADAADAAGVTRARVDEHMGTSDMGGWWLSRLEHRCAVPTWEQWLQLRELLNFGTEMDAEVWRLNGRKGSPGEAWITAEVIGTEDRHNEPSGIVNAGQGERVGVTRLIKAPNSEGAASWDGWGTALKPAHEPIIVARKPLAGTVAQNVLEHGTGALNTAGCRVEPTGESRARVGEASQESRYATNGGTDFAALPGVRGGDPSGRWPPNVVLGPEAAAELDRQSGVLTSGANPSRRGSDKFRDAYGDFAGQTECVAHRGADSGGASRFFPVFRYEAKAASAERPRGEDGTAHPTVKPVDLMAWLVRLVTPPGGLVLDPFAGSGTTAEACIVEGFRCVLIEKDPAYAELVRTRLRKPIQPAMFGEVS